MGARHKPNPEFKYRELPGEARQGIVETLKGKLQKDPAIVLAYLHGGFVDGGSFRDIDVALWVKDGSDVWHYTVDLSVELELEIGTPVDVQVLNEAPLPFRHEVLSRGSLLFSRDEGFRTRFLDATLRQYIDFRFMHKISSVGTI